MATAKNQAQDAKPNTMRGGPDERGHFGIFGGRFVAETLMPLILDLERAYDEAKADPKFYAQLENLNTHYAGRPSPLYFAERMTEHLREVSAAAGGKGGRVRCDHGAFHVRPPGGGADPHLDGARAPCRADDKSGEDGPRGKATSHKPQAARLKSPSFPLLQRGMKKGDLAGAGRECEQKWT